MGVIILFWIMGITDPFILALDTLGMQVYDLTLSPGIYPGEGCFPCVLQTLKDPLLLPQYGRVFGEKLLHGSDTPEGVLRGALLCMDSTVTLGGTTYYPDSLLHKLLPALHPHIASAIHLLYSTPPPSYLKDIYIEEDETNTLKLLDSLLVHQRTPPYQEYLLLYRHLSRLIKILKDTTVVLPDTNFSIHIGKWTLVWGDSKNNSYTPDSLTVIIDIGGDDSYMVNQTTPLIIDISGNDTYTGMIGVNGAVIDIYGNDTYKSDTIGIGVGAFGVGLCWDLSGDDIYICSHIGIGVGFYGIGLVVDLNGQDTYIGKFLCQGVGLTQGVGALIDLTGDDTYTVSGGIEDHREKGQYAHLSQGFAFGIRDIYPGGIGILVDGNGNDSYTGSYFVQGASYWFGMGILYDLHGNDRYTARRYSQGAGIHLSLGVLMDREGNDIYSSWGVSQGCGHDLACGILLDQGGNDTYSSEWLSQGAGNANGLGILADRRGNDIYIARKTSQGGTGGLTRNYHSIGILIDSNGDDFYSMGANDSVWVKDSFGVGVDTSIPTSFFQLPIVP